MKKILLGSLFIVACIVTLISCKKDENQVTFEDGTDPVLTASATAPVALNIADKKLPGITFNWTNPNFKFSTGVSSQDVIYTLQVDTTGANFTSKNLKELVITKELSTSLTVGDYNNLFAAWKENTPHNFEFRVKAAIGQTATTRFSNVIKRTITPYLDVAVVLPFTGRLWIIGAATPDGWGNPVTAKQEFTKTSSTTFEISIDMNGGQEFLILPDNGSWANKYAVKKDDITADGGPFGYNLGDNFKGPASNGKYKVVLNFKTGKFTTTKI